MCEFTYYEHFIPPPAILETQDEILLANLPPKWQLVCDNQIDRPIPFNSPIYANINKNDLCTCGISVQHIFLYESMRTCTNPDTSVTLHYTKNKALLAYDPSLRRKGKSPEQYQTTVPDYRAPDISYKKKPTCENPETIYRQKRSLPLNNVTVDDLISLSFPLSEAADFMETGRTFYIPSTQQVCKSSMDLSVPITQDMNFYFNIITVINFLTSIINAIIISVCYKNHKNLLSGILTVVMDTMEQKKVQALRLSDNELSTTNSLDVTFGTNNDTDYININVSIPWIFLMVLLSLLIIFTLYWIFDLLIRPLTRKSSICRYI